MENVTFDATFTDYFKNKLDGKSGIKQIAAIARFADILGDVFTFNLQSSEYLQGNKDTRFEIDSLITAYHLVTFRLLEDLIESVDNGENFDWSSVDFASQCISEISDLTFDIKTYAESAHATLSLFDRYFAHDSMSGSVPNDFRRECQEIRGFLIHILTTAVFNRTNAVHNTKTVNV